MLKAESLSQFIGRLSALPPRKRLEEYHAIQDPAERLQVARAMPAQDYSDMLGEAMVAGLNQHLRDKVARRNPSKAP